MQRENQEMTETLERLQSMNKDLEIKCSLLEQQQQQDKSAIADNISFQKYVLVFFINCSFDSIETVSK